jgi:hypothetical protein
MRAVFAKRDRSAAIAVDREDAMDAVESGSESVEQRAGRWEVVAPGVDDANEAAFMVDVFSRCHPFPDARRREMMAEFETDGWEALPAWREHDHSPWTGVDHNGWDGLTPP